MNIDSLQKKKDASGEVNVNTLMNIDSVEKEKKKKKDALGEVNVNALMNIDSF